MSGVLCGVFRVPREGRQFPDVTVPNGIPTFPRIGHWYGRCHDDSRPPPARDPVCAFVPCTIQHSKAAIHYRVKEAKEQQHAYIREG